MIKVVYGPRFDVPKSRVSCAGGFGSLSDGVSGPGHPNLAVFSSFPERSNREGKGCPVCPRQERSSRWGVRWMFFGRAYWVTWSAQILLKKGQFRCARRSPIALGGTVDVLLRTPVLALFPQVGTCRIFPITAADFCSANCFSFASY